MKKSASQYYRLMEIDKLVVEPYQREIQPGAIKKWSKTGFNPLLIGTIVVSFRDGKYNVVDGQHRTVLAKAHGVKQVMAQIYDGLNYEEEAELFNALNGANGEKKKLTQFDMFNASVEAKDKTAVGLQKVVNECGFELKNGCGNYYINSMKKIKAQFEKMGEANIRETLNVLSGAWGGVPKSLHGDLIVGVSEFIAIYEGSPNFKIGTLIKQLAKENPETIMTDSKSDKSTKSTKMRVMNQILKYYNHGLRKQVQNKHFA